MKITATEYAERRKRVCQAMPKNSVIYIQGATKITRSNDTYFRFRQNSVFHYLTGFDEPDAALVLIREDGDRSSSILSIMAQSETDAIWNNKTSSKEDAEQLGFESVKYAHEIMPVLSNPSFSKWSQKELAAVVHSMRQIKSPSEIEVIKTAIQISAAAFKEVLRGFKNNKYQYEYQIHADFVRACSRKGCLEQAYEPIVGSDRNGCCLHYCRNMEELKNDSVILLDAGAEYQGYASDITRMFFRSNRLASQVYKQLLRLQKSLIALVKPGETFKSLEDSMLAGIKEILRKLKVDGDPAKYCPHGVGHQVGLDVHDPISWERSLEPGMVITIEPGLYFPSEFAQPMGFRIEDMVLVTAGGHEVLTAMIPK